MSKKTKKAVKNECHICNVNENNPVKYGPIHRLGDFYGHYYCVLLSSDLYQRGNDNEGILGFLLDDIKAYLKKISTKKCCYCGKTNASIHCNNKKCKKAFHYPCGLERGALNQFFDQFKSFCVNHRPVQKIPQKVVQEANKKKPPCNICLDELDIKDKINTLWASCCSKTWYHKDCLQKLAYSAGYLFKCSICSDNKKFLKLAQQFGIYIPQRDAAWELEPNAYQDLLFRVSRCDASNCICPKGRNYSVQNTGWKIIFCSSCGAQGIHKDCGKIKGSENWECNVCIKVTNRISIRESCGHSSRSDNEAVPETSSSNVHISKKRVRESEENVFQTNKKRNRSRQPKTDDIELDVIGDSSDDETLELEEKTSSEQGSSSKNVSVPDNLELVRNSNLQDEGEGEKENVDVEENLDVEDNSSEDVLVDVESLDPEPSSLSNKNKYSNILTCIQPGPLSYKLGLIQDILHESEGKDDSDIEITYNSREDRKPEVIDLEYEDDDIQILEEKLISHRSSASITEPINISDDEAVNEDETAEILPEENSKKNEDDGESSDSGVFDIYGAVNVFQVDHGSKEINLKKSKVPEVIVN